MGIQSKINDKFEDCSPGAADAARKFLQEHDQVEYGMEVDVYGFGVMMGELLAHQAPWHDVPTRQVYKQVAAGHRPQLPQALLQKAPPGWVQLLNECWAHDATSRPSFNVIRHRLEIMTGKRTVEQLLQEDVRESRPSFRS